MQGFAGVFFQMGTCQIDGLDIAVFAFLFNNTVYFATDDDRFFELADLVTFGKIGIEIVFSGEDRNRGDLRSDGQTELDGFFHSAPVHDRQYARQCQVDRTGLCIGLFTEMGRSAAENFGYG